MSLNFEARWVMQLLALGLAFSADAPMKPSSAVAEPIEFVHIGKTAGGSIETTGAQLGLHWGEQRLWPKLSKQKMPCVRNNLLGGVFEGHSWWHVPRCHWEQNDLQPFDANKSSFCVVRHPYTRAVSAFGWRHHNIPLADFCNARELNAYVKRRLAPQLRRLNDTAACRLDTELGVDDCHWLPQWMYQPCDAVLRYENLQSEFDMLMQNYTARGFLNESRVHHLAKQQQEEATPDDEPSQPRLSKAVHMHTCSLTASALDASSRAMLHEVYARDFAELGYSSRASREPTQTASSFNKLILPKQGRVMRLLARGLALSADALMKSSSAVAEPIEFVLPGQMLAADSQQRPFCNDTTCLPRLFIIGTAKGGSSSLHFQVAGAPSITALCGLHYAGDINSYDVVRNTTIRVQHCTGQRGGSHGAERHLYDSTDSFVDAEHALHAELRDMPALSSQASAVLHYTPHYLWSLGTAQRILATYNKQASLWPTPSPSLPQLLKFIVIVREPVARAISSYWFTEGSHGVAGPSKPHGTGGSVEHARDIFKLEMDLLRPCLPQAHCFASPNSSQAPPYARCANDFDTCLVSRSESLSSTGYPSSIAAHVGKGLYAAQLLRWFAIFSPRQFHVLPMERMYLNGEETRGACYHELFAWLGIAPQLTTAEFSSLVAQTPSNPTQNPSKRPFDAQEKRNLSTFFEDANLNLAALLGSTEVTSWWPSSDTDQV